MIGRLIEATRRNHALEHATIAVLLARGFSRGRLLGRSTHRGFYIHGDISTENLKASAEEALSRLQAGDADLAVSPLCGTNMAVAGLLAGVASTIALGRGNRVERLPNAVLAALGAIVASQPLGRLAQRHLTTSPNLQGSRIEKISSRGHGMRTMHKVEVRTS
jgi:hypothetical protein